jgi:hypothetical protein
MKAQPKQIGISPKVLLGVLILAVLTTAAGAALLIHPHVPGVVLFSYACYGGIGIAYFWTRWCAARLRKVGSDFQEAEGQVAALPLASASQSPAQPVSTEPERTAPVARQSAETGRPAACLAGEARQPENQSAEGLESRARTMRESRADAGKIGSIAKVVDEIAFQTNILALNAAIQGAGAGQSGAGFAAVAGEVRNLAELCARASQEIADRVQESTAKERAGEAEMERVRAAMGSLIAHTGQGKELAGEVAIDCHELARGAESVVREMQQLENPPLAPRRVLNRPLPPNGS